MRARAREEKHPMRIITVCVLVLSLVACGGPGEGDGSGISSAASSVASTHATADFCKKGDACNALQNVSVDECTATLDHGLNNLLPAEAHDLEASMQKCVQLEACKNFVACAQAIGKN
jgi:hypothetical protein